MARQNLLKHRDCPLLKCLRHEGVVCVAHAVCCDFPGLIPVQILLVNEDSHKLRDCNGGVGVIELDGCKVGQLSEVVALELESSDYVGKRACDEEVLLLEPQDLSHVLGVVGIQNLADVLCGDLLAYGLCVVSAVELCEAELLKSLGAPKSECVDCLSAVADDRGVVGHSYDLVGINPLVVVPAVFVDDFDSSAEVDRESQIGSGNLPRISVSEPVVGLLKLKAVLYLLAEDSVVVSDSVTE